MFYNLHPFQLSSIQFSHSVVSNSLQPHEPQHARPLYPSPTPGVHPNPCPLSWWCHPTIPSSVFPFSSCPQSFPASGSFQMSHSLHHVGKTLEFQLQHQSFQWIFRVVWWNGSKGVVIVPTRVVSTDRLAPDARLWTEEGPQDSQWGLPPAKY